MAKLHEGLQKGQTVTWNTVYGTATGIVRELTEKGALVQLPSMRFVLLSTHPITNPRLKRN